MTNNAIMKNIKNTKWFTLVELIIVITILAVLASIAFVSFQGYTRDARNTKRWMELSGLEKKIELTLMQGVSLKNLVKGTGSTIENSTIGTGSRIRIGWTEWYNALSGSYVWGDINTDILGVDEEDFKDSIANVSYKIAVTTHGQRYELAATIETDFWGDSLVRGTYNPRKSSTTRGNLDGSRISTSSPYLYFSGITFWETGLLVGDVVKVADDENLENIYTIISADNNKILLDRNLIETWQNVYLRWNETRNLVKAWRNFW